MSIRRCSASCRRSGREGGPDRAFPVRARVGGVAPSAERRRDRKPGPWATIPGEKKRKPKTQAAASERRPAFAGRRLALDLRRRVNLPCGSSLPPPGRGNGCAKGAAMYRAQSLRMAHMREAGASAPRPGGAPVSTRDRAPCRALLADLGRRGISGPSCPRSGEISTGSCHRSMASTNHRRAKGGAVGEGKGPPTPLKSRPAQAAASAYQER